jgi:hypothetical protein
LLSHGGGGGGEGRRKGEGEEGRGRRETVLYITYSELYVHNYVEDLRISCYFFPDKQKTKPCPSMLKNIFLA